MDKIENNLSKLLKDMIQVIIRKELLDTGWKEEKQYFTYKNFTIEINFFDDPENDSFIIFEMSRPFKESEKEFENGYFENPILIKVESRSEYESFAYILPNYISQLKFQLNTLKDKIDKIS